MLRKKCCNCFCVIFSCKIFRYFMAVQSCSLLLVSLYQKLSNMKFIECSKEQSYNPIVTNIYCTYITHISDGVICMYCENWPFLKFWMKLIKIRQILEMYTMLVRFKIWIPPEDFSSFKFIVYNWFST